MEAVDLNRWYKILQFRLAFLDFQNLCRLHVIRSPVPHLTTPVNKVKLDEVSTNRKSSQRIHFEISIGSKIECFKSSGFSFGPFGSFTTKYGLE